MAATDSSLSVEVHGTAFNNYLPLLLDCPFQINPPDWDGFGVNICSSLLPSTFPENFLSISIKEIG